MLRSHWPARALLCSLPLLGSLLRPLPACADEGDGVGLGPLFAFSASDQTPLLGWELAASFAHPAGRAALGGAYPLSRTAPDPGYHYLVWEPWYVVGATLGGALGNDLQPRAVYGAWGGMAMPLDRRFDRLYASDELQWAFSLSIGWRGVGANHQFYITPKLWRVRGVRIFS